MAEQLQPAPWSNSMTEQHPITPPPELFAEWFADVLRTLGRKVSEDDRGTTGLIAGAVAIQAARWGADQELEACIQWIQLHFDGMRGWCDDLRAARRPEPPSLKEKLKEAIYNENLGDALRLVEQLDD